MKITPSEIERRFFNDEWDFNFLQALSRLIPVKFEFVPSPSELTFKKRRKL
jgi:hypothetical protein